MVKYQGIKLCNSPSISILTYHDDNLRGGRVFVFDENKTSEIETYMSYLFK